MGITLLGCVPDNNPHVCKFFSLQKKTTKAMCISVKHSVSNLRMLRLYMPIRMLAYKLLIWLAKVVSFFVIVMCFVDVNIKR